MKSLSIVLLTFFTSNVFAMKCYLMPNLNNPEIKKIECRTHPTPDVICQLPEIPDDTKPDDIKVEQVPINDEGEDAGFIERMANKIGLKNLETRTRCTVDTDKRQARLDSERAAREAEEQAREAERLKRVEAKAALRAMKGKVKDLTKDEMAEFLEKVIELQAGE